MTIITLTRQFMNCWLEYVLSQPVDFDVSVMLHFVRSYLGIPVLLSVLRKEHSTVSDGVSDANTGERLAELVPQESYS